MNKLAKIIYWALRCLFISFLIVCFGIIVYGIYINFYAGLLVLGTVIFVPTLIAISCLLYDWAKDIAEK